MRSRKHGAIVAVLAAASSACTPRAEEVAPLPDAGLPRTVTIAGHEGDARARVDPDAGGSPMFSFCLDAYSADLERRRNTCAAADATLADSMARTAAKLCDRDLRVATDRSRASFDRDAADKCVEMLRDKALAQTSEVDTFFGHFPCDRVLVGLQDEGKPCLFSVECKEGLACVGYAMGTDGTCKKPPKVKDACTLQPFGSIINEAAAAPHHPPCAKGAYCDGTTCRPRVPVGNACGQSSSCADGLACVQGRCGARGVEGVSCAKGTDCAFGLWCEAAGDTGSGKCASKRSEGQPCSSEGACKGRCELPRGKDGKPQPPGKCVGVCGSG